MGSKILRGVIMGAPGSGKGTISSRISGRCDLIHISSGDLLRANVAEKTQLGLMADSLIKLGQLLPDDVMDNMIASELQRVETGGCKGWLLDGFPRTVPQADALNQRFQVDFVVNLDVPFSVIVDRLSKRWIHAPSGRVYNLDWSPPERPGLDDVTGEPLSQREDDTPDTVKKRLAVYKKQSDPIIRFYKNLGTLVNFQGSETNTIWPNIDRYLGAWD